MMWLRETTLGRDNEGSRLYDPFDYYDSVAHAASANSFGLSIGCLLRSMVSLIKTQRKNRQQS
jgi:hypothetical protein